MTNRSPPPSRYDSDGPPPRGRTQERPGLAQAHDGHDRLDRGAADPVAVPGDAVATVAVEVGADEVKRTPYRPATGRPTRRRGWAPAGRLAPSIGHHAVSRGSSSSRPHIVTCRCRHGGEPRRSSPAARRRRAASPAGRRARTGRPASCRRSPVHATSTAGSPPAKQRRPASSSCRRSDVERRSRVSNTCSIVAPRPSATSRGHARIVGGGPDRACRRPRRSSPRRLHRLCTTPTCGAEPRRPSAGNHGRFIAEGITVIRRLLASPYPHPVGAGHAAEAAARCMTRSTASTRRSTSPHPTVLAAVAGLRPPPRRRGVGRSCRSARRRRRARRPAAPSRSSKGSTTTRTSAPSPAAPWRSGVEGLAARPDVRRPALPPQRPGVDGRDPVPALRPGGRLAGTRSTTVRRAGFQIVALTPAPDATPIDDVGRARPPRLAIVLGAEGPGLAAPTLAAADVQVRIPIADRHRLPQRRPRGGDRLPLLRPALARDGARGHLRMPAPTHGYHPTSTSEDRFAWPRRRRRGSKVAESRRRNRDGSGGSLVPPWCAPTDGRGCARTSSPASSSPRCSYRPAWATPRRPGCPSIYGLYASIVPLLAYAVLGPSRILVLGPDSSLSPLDPRRRHHRGRRRTRPGAPPLRPRSLAIGRRAVHRRRAGPLRLHHRPALAAGAVRLPQRHRRSRSSSSQLPKLFGFTVTRLGRHHRDPPLRRRRARREDEPHRAGHRRSDRSPPSSSCATFAPRVPGVLLAGDRLDRRRHVLRTSAPTASGWSACCRAACPRSECPTSSWSELTDLVGAAIGIAVRLVRRHERPVALLRGQGAAAPSTPTRSSSPSVRRAWRPASSRASRSAPARPGRRSPRTPAPRPR